MLILGLLGMYFDAAVVFVTKSSLLFKLAVAILWRDSRILSQRKKALKIFLLACHRGKRTFKNVV